MKHRQYAKSKLYQTLLDVCETTITITLGVALVLSLVWSIEAFAADVQLQWNQDETVTVTNFNAERRDSTEPATWAPMAGEPVPTGGGGPYTLTDPGVSAGIYRYRVNAENSNGVSAWTYSTWATVGAGEPPGTPPTAPVLTIIIQQ